MGGKSHEVARPGTRYLKVSIRTGVSQSVGCWQCHCVFRIKILMAPVESGVADALGEGMTERVRKSENLWEKPRADQCSPTQQP